MYYIKIWMRFYVQYKNFMYNIKEHNFPFSLYGRLQYPKNKNFEKHNSNPASF